MKPPHERVALHPVRTVRAPVCDFMQVLSIASLCHRDNASCAKVSHVPQEQDQIQHSCKKARCPQRVPQIATVHVMPSEWLGSTGPLQPTRQGAHLMPAGSLAHGPPPHPRGLAGEAPQQAWKLHHKMTVLSRTQSPCLLPATAQVPLLQGVVRAPPPEAKGCVSTRTKSFREVPRTGLSPASRLLCLGKTGVTQGSVGSGGSTTA